MSREMSSSRKISRETLMANVQRESQENVKWIDCGFYLMPVNSSTLSQFGLSWYDVKIVDPLKSDWSSLLVVTNSTGLLRMYISPSTGEIVASSV